jgi:WD40 repeat protein
VITHLPDAPFEPGAGRVDVWDWRHNELIRSIASGSVRVWDTATGALQLTLRGHIGLIYNVSFSPDGRWLASYAADGTTRVWALDLDELADIARQRVTRDLTDAECQRYLRQPACADS